MLASTAPGVYSTGVRSKRSIPQALHHDIGAMVGFARRGPLFEPILIESYPAFLEVFGSPMRQSFLAQAMEGFFQNGGRACYVVRVNNREKAIPTRWTVYAREGYDEYRAFELESSTRGELGRDLKISVMPISTKSFELRCEIRGEISERFENLSSIPAPKTPAPFRYFKDVLNGQNPDSNEFEISTRPQLPSVGSQLIRVTQEYSYSFNTKDLIIRLTDFGDCGLSGSSADDFMRGFATLEEKQDVSFVVAPDLNVLPQVARPRFTFKQPRVCCTKAETTPVSIEFRTPTDPQGSASLDEDQVEAAQRELVLHCERAQDRIALLDVPFTRRTVEEALKWRSKFDSKCSALLFPALQVVDTKEKTQIKDIPASGHVAGTVARNAQRDLLQKPPANVALNGVKGVALDVSNTEHERLNQRGINVIQILAGRGIRCMGARTLSSDPDWRFLNVRILMVYVTRVLQSRLQWAVFESHSERLRHDVDRVVRSFLTEMWNAGQLDGGSEEEAFAVTCDESTHTLDDVDNGRLICLVELNLPWPAEVIRVQIGVGRDGVTFTEKTGGARG